VGLELASGLWQAGYPADLIPTSEVSNGSLALDSEGMLHYGPQRYAAAVLCHPQFERPEITAVFRQATRGGTMLFRMGDWTADFEGHAFDGNAALPSQMTVAKDSNACLMAVLAALRARRIAPQTPAVGTIAFSGPPSASPPAAGQCRLIDGTLIALAGQHDVAGDPIQTTLDVNGYAVQFDAVGVAAVRLAEDGRLEALAAGGLKRFEAGATRILLE